MKIAICTISTKSHLYKSFALLESVKKYVVCDLCCLVTDSHQVFEKNDINFHQLENLHTEIALKIINKYKGDKLRWSLKSVYVSYLLKQGYEKVIYVDNDIFFFDAPHLLFEELNQSNFLLTPHFYIANPNENQNWLEANYRVGLYNAGFFGANQQAIPILDWWTDCCLYTMTKSYWRGLYDDQKYLDLIPILFEKVKIIKDRGCNLAGWNDKDFNNQERVTFIHFADLTLEKFSGSNHPMHSYYKQYVSTLKRYNPNFSWSKNRRSLNYWSNAFYYLRWKLTRLISNL